MQKEKKSILIIDSCPLICEAYKSIINTINKKKSYQLELNIKYCIEDIHNTINQFIKKGIPLDLIILELKLPLENNKVSGEDLANKIKIKLPNTKIIITTRTDDNFRIHNLFKTINPDGFILKRDLTSTIFKRAIDAVINNTPFYSASILKLLRKEISSNFLLDSMDRKILYELSMGSRMKDMPNYIPLSVTSIEKRKSQLKKVFNITEKGDRELILIAKEKGFI